MNPAQPFALRLFVPSGMPDGMRIVEKSNWSGIGSKEGCQRAEPARAPSKTAELGWRTKLGLASITP
jgi:hypothetical protein